MEDEGEREGEIEAQSVSGDNEPQAANNVVDAAPTKETGDGDGPESAPAPTPQQPQEETQETSSKIPEVPETITTSEKPSLEPEGVPVECDRVSKASAIEGVCPPGYSDQVSSSQSKRASSLQPVDSLTSIRKKLLSDARVASNTSITHTDRMNERLKPQVRYMNSYRLDSKNPFHTESVHNVIREIFLDELKELSYEATTISKTCSNITAEIRSRVKALGFDRYKLVCFVQIIEKNNQSVNSVTKFLWDPERDNCASYFYEASDFVASGAVFGLYYEFLPGIRDGTFNEADG